MLEEVESDLEAFWELQREAESEEDLDSWLCVERKKYCCPKGHYGPKCKVRRLAGLIMGLTCSTSINMPDKALVLTEGPALSRIHVQGLPRTTRIGMQWPRRLQRLWPSLWQRQMQRMSIAPCKPFHTPDKFAD
jgi:hypothetical protein